MIADSILYGGIIIDTNAFDAKGNDFCGCFNAILPSFFATIRAQNIQLLSHPVLQGEVFRHIKTGELKTKPENAVSSLVRNRMYLELIDIPIDAAIQKLKELDLCTKEIEAYVSYYKDAVVLPYAEPSEVFRKYFESEPPFSDKGDKKAEFPDAFVLVALEKYLEDNLSTCVMVVSNDGDWISALSDKPNVQLVDSIDSALQLLNKSERKIEEYLSSVISDVSAYICDKAVLDIWFELYDYDYQEEIEVNSVRLVGIDNNETVPLLLSENVLTLQVRLDLEVDGSTTIIDYDNSVWDHEDKCYIFTSLSVMDFKAATGQVVAEIQIRFDDSQRPSLENVKFVAPHGVMLTLDEDNLEFTDLSFDAKDDAHGDMMDTLEDYYRH